MPSHKDYYPFLDVLRAVSVLWVMYHHAHFHFRLNEQDLGRFDFILHRLAEIGIMGVDMFFVISGFLITGLLLDDFHGKQMRIQRFYGRRFFKIVPHYSCVLLVALAMMTVFFPDGYILPKEILAYILFFQNYLSYQIPVVAHTWSIAIEEHFYFAYPLLLWIISKMFSKSQIRTVVLIGCFMVLIVLGNVLRFFGLQGDFTHQYTHLRFDALIFGCLIRVLEPWIVKNSGKTCGSICCVIAVLTYFWLFIDFSYYNWYAFSLSYLAAGLIIIASLTKFRLFLELERAYPLIWIGKSSYGIYLWHYLVIFFILCYAKTNYVSPQVVLTYAVTSILLGRLTTITIERYFLNLRNKWIP